MNKKAKQIGYGSKSGKRSYGDHWRQAAFPAVCSLAVRRWDECINRHSFTMNQQRYSPPNLFFAAGFGGLLFVAERKFFESAVCSAANQCEVTRSACSVSEQQATFCGVFSWAASKPPKLSLFCFNPRTAVKWSYDFYIFLQDDPSSVLRRGLPSCQQGIPLHSSPAAAFIIVLLWFVCQWQTHREPFIPPL